MMHEPAKQAFLPTLIRDSENNAFSNQTGTPSGVSLQNKVNTNESTRQQNNTITNIAPRPMFSNIVSTNSFLMDSVPTPQENRAPPRDISYFQSTFSLKDAPVPNVRPILPRIPVSYTPTLPAPSLQSSFMPQSHSKPKPEPEPQNPTEQAITRIIDAEGGVSQVNKVTDFIDLLKNENSEEIRSVLLTMMISSRPTIQEAFIAQKGLAILDNWLEENSTKLVLLVLKLLTRLPVDMQSLKTNGKIGKTVKKLGGSSDKKIKKQAKSLFKSWMKLVDRSVKAKENSASKKRKDLGPKTEPPKKIPRLSSAFRTKEQTKSSYELKIVKRTPVSSTNDNQSNKVTKPKESKPPPKPLQRLIEPKNKIQTLRSSHPPLHSTNSNKDPPTPLKRSSDSYTVNTNTVNTNTVNTSTQSVVLFDKHKKPLSSCIPDPNSKKKNRSISWASDEQLVRVKHFPRDKTLAFDNPNMRAIKARLAMNQQIPQQAQQAPKPVPSIPQMRPSISRWATPIPIKLSGIKIAMGEESKEAALQRDRERTALRARYSAVRLIPNSPSNDKISEKPLRDAEIPCIPLHDRTAVQPQQVPPSQPQQNYYAGYNAPPTGQYGQQAPGVENIFNALRTGSISSEFVQNALHHQSPQSLQVLTNLLAQTTQQQPYPQQNTYPNYSQTPPNHSQSPQNQHYQYNQTQQTRGQYYNNRQPPYNGGGRF